MEETLTLGGLEDLSPNGQAARKDVLGLAEGVLRDVDSSKDALAALRTALAAEAEGKQQLMSEVAGRISGARDQLCELQDAVGRMREGRPQAVSLAELERAQKRAKDLDEDLMQEEVRTRYSLSLLNGKAVSGSPAS